MTFQAALAGAPFGTLMKQIGKKTRKAWHGSPHDFPAMAKVKIGDEIRYTPLDSAKRDGLEILEEYPKGKFDLAKIGTGEGAQAYGHGLYFSSSEDIARFYRDSLARHGKLDVDAQNAFGAAYPSGEAVIGNIHYPAQDLANAYNSGYVKRGQIPDALADHFDRAKGSGKLYTVEIPDESHMLDWDKPLSEQPESVREALAGIGIEDVDLPPIADKEVNSIVQRALQVDSPENVGLMVDNDFDLYQAARSHAEKAGLDPDEIDAGEYIEGLAREHLDALIAAKSRTGEKIYRSIAPRDTKIIDGPDQIASAKLRELGIPGITYKGATSGERNFVVFDDAMTNIVEKGFADPALIALAGGGAGLAGMAMQPGFASGFAPTDPTIDMAGLEAYSAGRPMPSQTPLSDYSAMDWLKGGLDTAADAASAIAREPAVGGATIMDYLMGWPADKMDERAAARREYMDYQPRTELGGRLSESGERGMVNMIAPVLAPMMPEEYTQRMLEAYLGTLEKKAPRELRALGGLYDFTDVIF